ncbi:MAG TPA: hypothetical protein VNO75_12385 [Gemmatimonadaceae bacterium]|nr:hypothetical protein [Gemmatimonadaceae bacterium]
MLEKKTPVKIASLARVIAPPEEVELPDGTIVPVRPFDALGYELFIAIEADPAGMGDKVWDLTHLAIPKDARDAAGNPLTAEQLVERIKGLTPVECRVIVEVAAGRINEVKALADAILGNAPAPTTAEPETQRSPILSDSSASGSPKISDAQSMRSL